MSQQKPDPTRPRRRRAAAFSGTPPGNAPEPPEKLPTQPTPDDHEAWKAYWEAHQQPWRKKPDIDAARQQEFATCYKVTPDIENGTYPFRDTKLDRADIEWLLATYGKSFTPEKGLDVRGANLNGEDLSGLPLRGLRGGLTFDEWVDASEEQRKMATVQMNNIRLNGAQLQGAHLNEAQLQDAYLYEAQLQGAQLYEAQLQRAYLSEARLQGAQFSGATLAGFQGIGPQLVDVQWDGFNLAIVDWSQVKILGNEYAAQQKKDQQGSIKDKKRHLDEYREAVRANRQLAVALQAQGLNEDAARFAYRANMLQRKVLWFQVVQSRISLLQRVRKLGAWCFSHLLNLLAGYGYRPERSFLAYLLIVLGFMSLYLLTGHFVPPHLSWDEALVLSLSSFHGRGFFTQTLTLGDPFARLAVAEAVLGLFVEVSLIATFTQRFLGK